MWVPISVYVLYALVVLRPDFLNVSLAHTGDAWGITFSALFVFFQLALVFGLPLGLLGCALPGETWKGIWWLIAPLTIVAALGSGVGLLFTESGAAQARLLSYATCLIASLTYFAKCMGHRNPRQSHRAPFALGVLTCVSVWSLVSFAALHYSANQIANGADYRILLGQRFDYEPPTSWLDLRGVDLGEEMSNGGGSEDYNFTYYALLRVDGRSECWNWSKRALRFEEIVRTNPNHLRGCDDT